MTPHMLALPSFMCTVHLLATARVMGMHSILAMARHECMPRMRGDPCPAPLACLDGEPVLRFMSQTLLRGRAVETKLWPSTPLFCFSVPHTRTSSATGLTTCAELPLMLRLLH